MEQEEKTASGLVLPETAEERPQTAQVMAVGDSEEMGVSEGNHLVFAKCSGTKIRLGNEDYMILNYDALFGAVEA